jgi:hypothetical protein
LFSPDGGTFATIDNGAIQLWGGEDGLARGEISGNWSNVVFSHDGAVLAVYRSAREDNAPTRHIVGIWSALDGRNLSEWTSERDFLHGLRAAA